MKRDGVGTAGDGGRPWTEAEWERFIREQDQLAAARPTWDADDVETLRELGLRPTDSAAPAQEPLDECAAQIRFIPAFRLARDFAAEVDSLGTIHRQGETWRSLHAEAQRVAFHIASGHGLGYEDSHICGNIVKCRDALRGIERSIALLHSLQSAAPGHEIDDLLGTAVFVRQALMQRIATLRTRVWWDDGAPVSH